MVGATGNDQTLLRTTLMLLKLKFQYVFFKRRRTRESKRIVVKENEGIPRRTILAVCALSSPAFLIN